MRKFKVPEVVKRNEGIIVGVIVLGTGIIGYSAYKKGKDKRDAKKESEKMAKSLKVKTINTPTGKMTVSYNPRSIAKQLGLDFGYAYPIYDPRRWTENDSKVFKTLLTIPPSQIKAVSDEFRDLYDKSLEDVSQKLLPEKDWLKVEPIFKGQNVKTSGGSATDFLKKYATDAVIR